jgi:hypothetical protein
LRRKTRTKKNEKEIAGRNMKAEVNKENKNKRR